MALSRSCMWESGFSYVDKLTISNVQSTAQRSPVTVIATSIKRKKVILPALVVHACYLYILTKQEGLEFKASLGYGHILSRGVNINSLYQITALL